MFLGVSGCVVAYSGGLIDCVGILVVVFVENFNETNTKIGGWLKGHVPWLHASFLTSSFLIKLEIFLQKWVKGKLGEVKLYLEFTPSIVIDFHEGSGGGGGGCKI